jgi:hypothetical protein
MADYLRTEPDGQARHGKVRGGSEQIGHRSLDDLLSMAHRYRGEDSVWQATEMYWRLSDDYSGTPQSLEAEKSLLEMAETYERAGARHMARAIYERLGDLA